jgi:hypothetical protein
LMVVLSPLTEANDLAEKVVVVMPSDNAEVGCFRSDMALALDGWMDGWMDGTGSRPPSAGRNPLT